MEGRKYSTGTKGRLKMHSDLCRQFIHEHAPSFALAQEFVGSIDPAREDSVWQRFQEPGEILPLLEAWLNGDAEPTTPSRPSLKPASTVPATKHLSPSLELAFKKTSAWIASEDSQLDASSPREAAMKALDRLRAEL
jgi:hypothetical protein